jgi:iron complex transport system substrate-binding protein
MAQTPLHATSDWSRRRFMAALLASPSVAAILAACGDDDAVDSGAPTRSVYSNNGPIDVPVDPQRVVAAIGSFDIDIYAVGITPVLTTYFAGGWAQLPESVVITQNIPPTPEELLPLNPDLMIGWNWVTAEPVFDELAKIAPYVGLGEEEGSTWRSLFVHTCDAVNRKAKAEELLAGLDRRASALREARAGRPDITVARIEFYEPGAFSWRSGADTEITAELMELIGLTVVTPPDDVDDSGNVSLERLGEISADWIVVPVGSVDIPDATFRDIEALELWQEIPAVKAGRVIEVDGNLWPGYGYLFAEALLDDLDRIFVQAGL